MTSTAIQTSTPDLMSYDHYIVAFSGGKDSVACLLHLLDQGVSRDKIELWHHDIDGGGSRFMDWPVTADYCRKFAEAFGVKIFFSWKEGGFLREMMREDTPTAPTTFETPEGLMTTGGKGKAGTRLQFPQVTADLTVRWCSAYLKIDVCAAALRNQPRFSGKRVLVLSGERAEESAARAKYNVFEPDRSDLRDGRTPRHIDRWRAVHGWSEEAVWSIIQRFSINPHPAYKLGWSRVSCMKCIFANGDQWASAYAVDPKGVEEIELYEGLFGKTIHRTLPVGQRRATGTPYPSITEDQKALSMSEAYTDDIFVTDWTMPAGAFKKDGCGPI